MPHLAAIVGAGVIVAGVCIVVNHALDERRRQREEDREFEAAIAASLYEFEQDSQRRHRDEEEAQESSIATAVARSEVEGSWNGHGTMLRRRRASGQGPRSTRDPFADPIEVPHSLIEMTERVHLQPTVANVAPLIDLFDAGPSSRASDPTYFESPPPVPSPRDAATGSANTLSSRDARINETPSSIQAFPPISRVTSPFSDPIDDGFQHVTAASSSKAGSDAGTDTTGVLISRPSSPTAHDTIASPTSADQSGVSLPVSPSFSAISFTDARETQTDSENRTADRDIDSAWSDLGEDSSEDEVEQVADSTASDEVALRGEVRRQRMQYLGRLDRGNGAYAPLL